MRGAAANAERASTVMPLLRSSSDVSSAHDRYQLSRFFSLASRSYFSSVRLSTWPVRTLRRNEKRGGKPGGKHEMAADGGLAGINVADEDDVERLARVFSLNHRLVCRVLSRAS